MKCNHKSCKRTATMSNLQYFKGIWYCTFHGNKAVREGRRIRKQKNKGFIHCKENGQIARLTHIF